MAILDLYGQFEPSPWQLLQLDFFSLKFHFVKSPPLSIKPEVHRVGESKRGSNPKQFPDNWRPARHFGSALSFQDSITAKHLLDGLFCGWVIVTAD